MLDAKDAYLCPGLVDIHIHGAAGVMCDRAGVRELGAMSMVLARLGTTSFLATISSSERDMTLEVLSAVREASAAVEGARILGAHMEGPYLNPVRAGAQRPDVLRTYSKGELSDYLDAAGGTLSHHEPCPGDAGGSRPDR